MTSRRKPSFNALHAFEATARHGSVTLAANELCVTPSAVTHQVRKLEEYLGVSLISFANGKLRLSDQASNMLPGVANGFSQIATAVKLLDGLPEHITLTVASRSFFAAQWLAPRLHRFWERHPEIGLRMNYSNEPVDVLDSNVDISIEWANSSRPNLHCEVLFPGFLSPICSSSLLEADHKLSQPADLAFHTLLRESENDYWNDWLDVAGVPDLHILNSIYLDDGTIRQQMAIKGKGIEMTCPRLLTPDMLSEGNLILPFEDIQLEGYFFVICNPSEQLSPKIKAFRDWLFDELE